MAVVGEMSAKVIKREDSYLTVPTLEEAIVECSEAFDRFCENSITESFEIAEKWADESMYHAMFAAAIRCFYSVLTLEKEDTHSAKQAIKKALSIIKYKRRPKTISTFFWGPNADDYTDEEAHAELCFGEAKVLSALITFLSDQTIFALIKCGFKLKAADEAYKVCYRILKKRTKWGSDSLRVHFESGTRTGVGAANLALSNLPHSVTRFLEMTGFSGNREKGIYQLMKATQLKKGIRRRIAILSVAGFNLFFETFFGIGKGDLDWCNDLLEELRDTFPQSCFILLFAGRLKQLQGNTDQAIEYYTQSINAQTEWKQIHNMCYWELIWCYGIKANWAESAKYAKLMGSQCNWSPAVNMHQYAAFTYMQMVTENKPELREKVTEAMLMIPKLRRKFGGKTVPPEKFAVVTSEKYNANGGNLMVPALELFYFFNIFSHTGGRAAHLDPMLEIIDKELNNYQVGEQSFDDYALLNLLKGVCLRFKGNYKEAVECFREVLENEHRIEKDTHIPPRAALELGISFVELNRLEEGSHWLTKARNDYKGFLVEAVTQVRIHVGFRDIKEREKKMSLKSNGKCFVETTDDWNLNNISGEGEKV